MRIIELFIQGFRSFKDATWRPGALNVLIGPNASGKSNLLRYLELLSTAARGSLAKHVQAEGGVEAILWDGQVAEINGSVRMSPLPPYTSLDKDSLTFEMSLSRLGNSSSYLIQHELLGNYWKVRQGIESQPFKLLERDAHHAVVFSMDSQRFEAPPTLVGEAETLLSMVAGPFTANRYIGEFQQELSRWKIYQGIDTRRDSPMRGSQVAQRNTEVDFDGQNLVTVLHSLYTSSRDFERELNAAMRVAFGTDFDKLVFPPAADQRIQMRIRWHSLTRERSSADLSDGTLRFLFLMAVLANPNPPPLIAIDEPETGLHPSMLPIIAEYAIAASKRTQVIMTTHSAEFLDAFGDHPPTTTIVEGSGGKPS